ncbi:MAG: XRE family transcriptional regulator, partial [Clostridia bacterium]|nr:XRE family transcriptional regulator [Clostridia bacterium]
MNQFDQIGKNIRLRREAAGMTQSELAERLFVSFQAVSAWERGQSVPDLENAVRLSELFGVSVDALIKDSQREVFVGIDGGGTKTEFVSFLADGTVIGRVVTEGSNPNDVGAEKCLDILFAGLSKLLQGTPPAGIFA